jgi:hypothetical protein
LAISSFWVQLGAFREAWLKPVVYGLLLVVMLFWACLALKELLAWRFGLSSGTATLAAVVLAAAGLVGMGGLATSVDWLSYVMVRRFTLDANHAWVSLLAFVVCAAVILFPDARRRLVTLQHKLQAFVGAGLALAAMSGIAMFLKFEALSSLTRLGYTGLEIGLILGLFGSAAVLILRLIVVAAEVSATPHAVASGSGGDVA